MPNTYTQIHIHAVWPVKFRATLISPLWKEQLHKYITGILQNHSHKMIAINSMPDHLHMLFGMRPNQSLSDLMRTVKGESSEWINKEKLSSSAFKWQEGFGAFSHAISQVSRVAEYIANQEIHHQKKTFLEEYEEFMKLHEIDYDKRYIFTEPV